LRVLALSIALLAAGAAVAAPQEVPPSQKPPAFPTRVEQVTVDVVVTDRKGQPITDLKPGELEVFEDGVRQAVSSFDLFQVPATPAAPGSAPVRPSVRRVSSNADTGERRGRTFVIVFDDVHLGVATAQRAKAAVAEFLRKETREGDQVTLLATAGGAWWTARMEAGRVELLDLLKRLEGRLMPETRRDWLSDYEAMRINVFRDNSILDRVQRRFETYGIQTLTQQSAHVRDVMAVEDPVVTSRAAEVYLQAVARNHVTLGAMERALKGLATVKGRKSVVLVSEGFVYDTNLSEFKRLIDASRRVNAAIYFVNARGLEGLPDALSAEYSTALPQEDLGFAFSQEAETQEGSVSLAADSGGFTVRNSNDLAAGLERIADETRAYYLIGYNPTNTARDGLFRKIQVKVPGRKGIQVRARAGYYAPLGLAPQLSAKEAVEAAFQGALDSPYEADDVPLRMTHFVREETLFGKARVFVATEVDIRRLVFQEKDGQATGALQYILVAAHRQSGETFRYDQTLELKLPPAVREDIGRTWLPIVRDFELGPGAYQAKIVVRDKSTGHVGTVVHNFEVPDLAEFRVSTPVLSDVRERPEDGTPGDQVAIVVRRDFPQGASLFCQFEVYGATREEESRKPRVSMGYEVRTSGGAIYTRDRPSLIVPTPQGALSRLIGFSLEDAAPGDYELLLKFKDELSGNTLELHEPFSVSPRLPAAPPAPAGE
jgi:VWFA-related protein